MRMRELIEQPRLSDARFTHYRNHLTVACSRLFQCFAKLLRLSSRARRIE